MSTHREPRFWRVPGRLVVHLIDGLPWTVSHVRPNPLRQHCRQLARTFRVSNPIADRLRPRCRRLFEVVADRSGLLTAVHPSEFRSAVLIRMVWYSDAWCQPPEDWWPDTTTSPRVQWRSLLRHLFGPYPVPAFFESAWFVEGPLSCPERDWYCLASAGKSLRRAQGMPPSVSARALHLAMQAPADFTIRQALRWGQLRALGCRPRFRKLVLESGMASDFRNDAVWLKLMAKVAVTRSGQRDFGKVVDFLAEELRWTGSASGLKWVGLPWDELRTKARRFWRKALAQSQQQGVAWPRAELGNPLFRLRLSHCLRDRWEPMPEPPLFESGTQGRWRWEILQLTTQLELMMEGRAMKNCLATYGKLCREGRAAIFSFRLAEDWEPTTRWCVVDVDPSSRKVMQVRDRANHRLPWQSVPFLRDWARRHGLN
ncbi:PcfJ domain-containing protein [Luteolibacter sp. LG18]|uniref:PcfJ domain-containing protein n=1 Tax=Luteolibacter sp. LG18 TaxID=2819286 RepID=UPI002B2F79E4|nr:hypothetical protein llg_13700 [Luteolibacter sp. LG18]